MWSSFSVLFHICNHFVSLWSQEWEATSRVKPQMLPNISQKPVNHFRREQCTFSQLQLPFILHGIQEAFLQFLSRLVTVQTNNRNSEIVFAQRSKSFRDRFLYCKSFQISCVLPVLMLLWKATFLSQGTQTLSFKTGASESLRSCPASPEPPHKNVT